MKIEVKILDKKFYSEESNGKLLNHLPIYATSGSAAVDLVCTCDVTLYPQERVMIPTGLAIWIASAYPYCGQSNAVAGLILPRSGLGTRGLVLANLVGLCDEDYQGELMVSAWNSNALVKGYEYMTDECLIEDQAIELKAGERFAQLLFIPVIKAQWEVVDEFSSITERGTDGFGSTGE